MKISLLLEREPFPAIFEETMARYFSAVSGAPTRVAWRKRTVRERLFQGRNGEDWLCNTLVNAVFHPFASKEAMALPRHWYGRGGSLARTIMQQGYVRAATSQITRGMVAPYAITIDPCPAQAAHCLIAGGNTRLRLFDFKSGEATTILKSRFDPVFVSADLEVRKAHPWLPAPPVLRVLDEGRAYAEPIISARTAAAQQDKTTRDAALEQVLEACARLGKETHAQSLASRYLRELAENCRAFGEPLRQRNQALSSALERWLQRIETEASRLDEGRDFDIATGCSHGDLAPGNVLIDGEQVYLIDWERTNRRILGFDAITLALASRRETRGLWQRARAVATGNRSQGMADTMAREALSGDDPAQMEVGIFVYLTEELLFHLQESFQGPISVITLGLLRILDELKQQ